MKKVVRQCAEQHKTGGKNRRQILKEFSRMLDDQVNKFLVCLLRLEYILANTSGSVRVLEHTHDFDLVSTYCGPWDENESFASICFCAYYQLITRKC